MITGHTQGAGGGTMITGHTQGAGGGTMITGHTQGAGMAKWRHYDNGSYPGGSTMITGHTQGAGWGHYDNGSYPGGRNWNHYDNGSYPGGRHISPNEHGSDLSDSPGGMLNRRVWRSWRGENSMITGYTHLLKHKHYWEYYFILNGKMEAACIDISYHLIRMTRDKN